MLDTSPRIVLVQNVGMFSVGKDLNAAKIAGDLTETNARVISSVEETSTYKFIPFIASVVTDPELYVFLISLASMM